MSIRKLCLIISFLVIPKAAMSAEEHDAAKVLISSAATMGQLAGESTLNALGSISADGRVGQWEDIVSGDGRFVTRMAFRLFKESDGFDGRVRWTQDRSGASHELDAPFTRADAISESWLRRRGYLRDDADGARIDAVTHDIVAGVSTTVLTATPKGGNPVRLTFDDRRNLLLRVERDRPITTIVESYGDYRKVGALLLPFKIEIRSSDGTRTINVATYKISRSSHARRFSKPAPPNDTRVKRDSSIALSSEGFPIILARVNGRDYYFIFDTGGHNILTPQAAAELGLKTEGRGSSGGSGASRVSQSDTHVAKLEIGEATISNQHFYVIDLGFNVNQQGKISLGGILGLETLARVMVTFDESRKVLAIASLDQPHTCEGYTVPLMFDDHQPVTPGTIDGTPGLLGIDTGNAGPTIVFGKWAHAHGLAEKLRKGTVDEGYGIGGKSQTWKTPHHDVSVGPANIRDIFVNYAEMEAGAFSSRSDAANIGADLLKRFKATFDYQRHRLCLVPSQPA